MKRESFKTMAIIRLFKITTAVLAMVALSAPTLPKISKHSA